MATKYSVPGKTGITLVKKGDAWVPKKEERKTTLELHGYTVMRNLGEGAFAKVKLAKSKKHNCHVAIKIIDKRKAPKDYIYKFLPREIRVMHKLNHPNVIQLYEAIETETKVYLILELAEGGDLLEYINKNALLPEERARVIFCQFVATMAYCHKERVVHRDLKCENLLLDANGRLKITDFGFACNTHKTNILQTFCGSYAYCSPEILRGDLYDGQASDIWSMGVVLYALVCARLPFGDDDLRAIMNREPRKLRFSKKTSKECRELIRKMLALDEKKRPTAEELLHEPWCKEPLRKMPELAYLGHRKPSMTHIHPSPPPPPPINEYVDEVFPATVHPLCDQGVVSCLAYPGANIPIRYRYDRGRRHTIAMTTPLVAGNQNKRRVSLRDELLRTIADKVIRKNSSQLIAEEMRQSKSLENIKKINQGKHPRRASIVHDVIEVDRNIAKERRMSMSTRKKSIVADVVYNPEKDKVHNPPKKFAHLEARPYKGTVNMPGLEVTADQDNRRKELASLKFSKAGTAARVAAKEAHREVERRRASVSEGTGPACDERLKRLEKWRMKCMKILNKTAVVGDNFSFTVVSQGTESQG